MNYNTEIIRTYMDYLDLICKTFNNKLIQKFTFYNQLGMGKQTFSRKLESKSFTPDSSIKIS